MHCLNVQAKYLHSLVFCQYIVYIPQVAIYLDTEYYEATWLHSELIITYFEVRGVMAIDACETGMENSTGYILL